MKFQNLGAPARILVYSLLAISVLACKKSKTPTLTAPAPPLQPIAATRADLTRDSIFYYAKEVYLWYDAIPAYDVFNPRRFTTSSSDLANYNAELFAISQLKINPVTNQPYEFSGSTSSAKYSYIFDSANKNPTAFVFEPKSAVDLDGNGNDLGIRAGLYGSATNYRIILQAVYPGSPAARAGLTRGATINQIDGQSIGTNSASEIPIINAALFGANRVVLGGTRKDGTPFSNLTLNKAVYTSNPILKDTVLVQGTKKIGYIAFARFSSPANAQTVLTNAFDKFATAGVNNLVVDLRYNGGGYVSTAEYLTNLIAPSSLNGQVMFVEHYNSLMQAGQAKILQNQPLLDGSGKLQYQNGKVVTYANVDYSIAANTEKFSKKGSLEGVDNVVFIVSSGTASASELVINSLKPHMKVKLVGKTTYGKPVGFFPIRIENKYDVYYSMFQTKNSAGTGEYFPGFVPDAVSDYDDAERDFGDRNESYIAKAIGYISTGMFSFTPSKTILLNNTRVSTSSIKVNNLNEDADFKGMIENRFKLKN